MVAKSKSGLGAKVSAAKKKSPPHLIILARAGTGKTTTLIEGLKVLRGHKPKINPSPQQEAIWGELLKSEGASSIAFAAFTRSIADELRERVPEGCEATTLHSWGGKIVRKAFPTAKIDSEGRKVRLVLETVFGEDYRNLKKKDPELVFILEQLIDKVRMNLVDPEDRKAVRYLIDHYALEFSGSLEEVFDKLPEAITLFKDLNRINMYDFCDMIWLPVVLRLPTYRFDLLLIDEAQDLNRCQQELALMSGKRLVLCGDPKQAIFGFAGADEDSIPNMEAKLKDSGGEVTVLPLNVTRRCGKAVVREAQRIVPDFFAYEENAEGKVDRRKLDTYRSEVSDGDMIVCRLNAPLISECFRFLREGKKAQIIGREIGQGLIRLIFRLMKYHGTYQDHFSQWHLKDKNSISILSAALDDWYEAEASKERAKKFPNETKIQGLADKRDCILAFSEGSVSDLAVRINTIFTDRSSEGIRLASIHKSKGLEARTVFFINNKSCACPSPMAKTVWARAQEQNLLYVAVTRAINRLVHVN